MAHESYVFPAVFEKSPQGHYGVFFPDLPGCVSMGDTFRKPIRRQRKPLGYIFGVLNVMVTIYRNPLLLTPYRASIPGK